MPFLRFTKDRRGIEHTFVMLASGRRRPRLLYWFRTPPGLRVGRAALDEDVVRLLERHHPAISFDWSSIVKAPGGAAHAGADARRQRRPASARPRQDRSSRLRAEPDEAGSASSAEVAAEPGPGAEVPSSGAWSGRTADLERLRGRYSELLARVTGRPGDPGVQQALRQEAELLNPDTWVTPGEVALGLESFDERCAALRQRLGRRGRRSRRGGTRHRGRAGGEAVVGAETVAVPSGDGRPASNIGTGKPRDEEDPEDGGPPTL